MSLLEAIGRAFTKEQALLPTVNVDQGGRVAGIDRADPRKQLGEYAGWVYSAATVRARASASVGLRLLAGEDEVSDHIFLDVWERPCEVWSGFAFRQVSQLHVLLAGNCYWYVLTNQLGAPAGLFPLNPAQVKVVPGTTRFIDGYKLGLAGGREVDLAPEEVIHLKAPNPLSPYYGMSVVEAAARGIDISNYIHDYAIASFRNHAVPAMWVKLSSDVPQGERRRVRAMIESAIKGVTNANRTFISGDAIESMTPITPSMSELAYLQGAEFSRDEIFALFGVHRSMVGMSDQINLANAQAGEYSFAKWVVAADLQIFADAVNGELLPRYDPRLRVEFDNPIPEDESRKGNNAQVAWQSGGITRDEFRSQVGFDATEDAVDGNVYSIPFNVQLVPAGAPDATPTGNPSSDAGAGAEPSADGTPPPAPKRKSLIERKQRTRGSAEPYIHPLETKLSAEMVRYFERQRRQVTGRLRNELRSKDPDVFHPETERRGLYETLLPFLYAAAGASLAYLAHISGTNLLPPDGSLPPDIAARVSANAGQAAQIITATTSAQLAEAIAAARASGEDVAGLLEAAGAVFVRAASSRAPLIGRQETSMVFHQSMRLGMMRGGYAYKAWVTAGDGAVEETCQSCEDDGVIAIDDSFSSGDFEPPTDEHPNCRCVLMPLTAAEAGEATA